LVKDARSAAPPSAPPTDPRSPYRGTPGAPPVRASAGPPGTMHAEMHSADPQRRWDVYYDDEAICSTPCARWVDPLRHISLRTRDSQFGVGTDMVNVDGLDRIGARTGAVVIRAHPTSRGELAGGITMTTFGGMAVLAGAALISVSYATTDHDGMRTAGYASGIPGLIAVAGGIWLMLDSRPRATVDPVALPFAARRRGATVMAGPGFLAGRF
jgi:hypothetical protein